MTDPLAGVSDATIMLAGAWALGGYVLGFVAAVVVFWRRIRKPSDGLLRLLRWQVDDDAEHLRQLYRMTDRLARQLVEAEARNAELRLRIGAAEPVV